MYEENKKPNSCSLGFIKKKHKVNSDPSSFICRKVCIDGLKLDSN